MDPNETLKRLRELVRDALNPEHSDEMDELAMHVDALDEWLRNGGFLPNEWAGKDGARMTANQANKIASFVKHSGVPITRVEIGYSPADLPNGYVAVYFTYEDGHGLAGGIDANGDMST